MDAEAALDLILKVVRDSCDVTLRRPRVPHWAGLGRGRVRSSRSLAKLPSLCGCMMQIDDPDEESSTTLDQCQCRSAEPLSVWKVVWPHSDSLTPYETFSKKLLWPTVLTSWHLS